MNEQKNLTKEFRISHLLSDLPVTTHWYRQITSTSTIAKKVYKNRPFVNPILIGSDIQTAGYGKQKRCFISNIGGVYFSLIVKVPQLKTTNQGLLTTGIAWCLHQTICQQFNITTDIKWVNDLLLHGKKIAGILVEQITFKTVIIGVGCNVYQPNLKQKLASSTNLLDYPLTTEQFCIFVAQLVKKILSFLPNFTQGQFLSDYQKHLPMLGKKVTVKIGKKMIRGTAVKIDRQANLILNNYSQLITINSGEVVKIRQKFQNL